MEETRDNMDTDNKDTDNMDTDNKDKTTETVKKPKKKRCSYCKKSALESDTVDRTRRTDSV